MLSSICEDQLEPRLGGIQGLLLFQASTGFICTMRKIRESKSGKVMCAEKTGGFNLVNYRHSSGVYHEQETEDLHRRI
jgi:hypothetical protein